MKIILTYKNKNMNKLFDLENKYLSAKIAYYNGESNMSDAEFDALEKFLKEHGSKVHEQVGAKVKDYDFSHPTKMLSLSKIQTEKDDEGLTNYMLELFLAWYNKRTPIINRKDFFKLYASPKFDGNAINVIYIGGKLTSIITRGDGVFGKDVTKRLQSRFPKTIIMNNPNFELQDEDIIQIRCEVVIDKLLFHDKYKPLGYANPRNYVAGVIGGDTFDAEKVSELDSIPLHFLLNGEQLGSDSFMENEFVSSTRYENECDIRNYIDIIKGFEDMRDDFKYQLDGVVFAFHYSFREYMGENSHDPEWSIAIKFIPDEAVTSEDHIKWFVGKTGELAPVIQLVPVRLAGTTVRRVSGYNYGYIINQKLGKGAQMSIAKAGDIIPEIQSVIVESEDFSVIPTICPKCGTILDIEGIHLMCNNESCSGRIGKQLSTNAKLIGLKGVGPKTLDWFSNEFSDIIDLIQWVKTSGDTKDIENYGIKFNSRSHELFLNTFNNIKSVSYAQVIVMMGYNNVGLKLAEQIAKMYFGIEPDFTSQDRSLIDLLSKSETKMLVEEKAAKLIACGIIVDIPVVKEKKTDVIFVCMTGSPKNFGFSTKGEFEDKMGGILEDVSITSKDCQYLITDDLNSSSSKMKTAQKKGIEILTYDTFYSRFN